MRSLFSVLLIALFIGCSTEQKETTTRGKLHLYIPVSIAPVMIDEVKEFLALYSSSGAQITYSIVPAAEAARNFVHDTSRIVFLPIPLSQEEKDVARKTSPDFNELVIAYDGIAAVVHPTNPLVQMTTTDLQKILTGAITRWEQLGKVKMMKGKINIFIQDSSDVDDYLVQRLLRKGTITAVYKHTSSDLQTLHSVEKDPAALGFAALSWIDSAKSTAKVLNLGRTEEDTDTTFAPPVEALGEFFSPHPANILRNYYPLKRAIRMYTRTHVDLAAGFGTYAATAEGQKLFLKRGLLPGTQRIKLKANLPQ